MQLLKLLSVIAVALLVSVVFAGLVNIPAIAATEVQSSPKRVIFRDDDVTPWSLDALKAVNQVHIDEGVPVTLGVIPAVSLPVQGQYKLYVPTTSSSDTFGEYLRSLASSGQLELRAGSIESFVEYLRPLASSGRFELAQHGYNHSDNSKPPHLVPTEFRGESYATQYKNIRKGRSLMQNAWGFAPTTFVPPYNTGDQNTITALSRLGFKVYSSYAGEPISGGSLTLKPNRVSFDASTATLESLKSQTGPLLSNPSVNDIVITYHNWSFETPAHGVDAKKVELLRSYIQYLKTNPVCKVEFTTLNGAPPSKLITTNMTLSVSTTAPAVNQQVTFTATLKSGTTPLPGKSVTIYHYLNGIKYTDTTKTTVNGQITLTQKFGSTGPRTYYATFAGDTSYKGSTSAVVTITVR